MSISLELQFKVSITALFVCTNINVVLYMDENKLQASHYNPETLSNL